MSALEIEIRNESSLRVPIRRLKNVARKILKSLKLKNAGLGVLLVSDQAIRRLNRRFLKHDQATDVIAFEGEPPFLGDIVISLETTRRQAKEYGNPFFYELSFYLCHGILHLMGQDDGTAEKRQKMLKRQEKILSVIWPSKKPKR